MNWEIAGAIGEVVGAVAVVLSLVYLAAQVRVQTRESKLAAMHDISVGFRDVLDRFTSESDLFVSANNDWEKLTEAQRVRFMGLAAQYFLCWEEAFLQHEEGRLQDRNWNSIRRYFLNGLGAPSMQRAWNIRKTYYDSSFVKFVDSQTIGEYLTQERNDNA